jgi:hypothetical protein
MIINHLPCPLSAFYLLSAEEISHVESVFWTFLPGYEFPAPFRKAGMISVANNSILSRGGMGWIIR